MAKSENPKYPYWNGKNLKGQDHVGAKYLISEGPKNSKTGAKYDVSVDTVSARDLQK
ncbi:MAG: hypothetical protein N2491_11180 [Negativicutes bacterium]|nr:hypothetical protein [Negativicutes bacterium]